MKNVSLNLIRLILSIKSQIDVSWFLRLLFSTLKPWNLVPWLIKSSQSNSILQSSDSNFILSYLITTVLLNFINLYLVFKSNWKNMLKREKQIRVWQRLKYQQPKIFTFAVHVIVWVHCQFCMHFAKWCRIFFYLRVFVSFPNQYWV